MPKTLKKFSHMRKNGFKKDLPALPLSIFFHVYVKVLISNHKAFFQEAKIALAKVAH